MQQEPSDPVIDEVRAVRHRISEQCGHDPARLVAHYMKLQEQYRHRLIESEQPNPGNGDSSADAGGTRLAPVFRTENSVPTRQK